MVAFVVAMLNRITMLEQNVTVSFYLEKTKPNAENKCLIKMVIYCKPNKKRFSTNCHATIQEWEKLNSSKLRDSNLKEIKNILNTKQQKAEKIIADLVPFSFIAFEDLFYSNSVTKTNNNTALQHWFDTYVKTLNDKGRVGTASSYRTTINSLNEFKKGLHIQDVTPALLEEYEAYMLNKGNSNTTIGIYLRQLRAIINQVIAAGLLQQEKYPFKKYEIPSGQNIKKALSDIEINKLLNHTPTKEDEQKALDFWILSYLCSGINFADIVQLKPSNIDGSYLNFIRQKTKNTKKKDLRPIKIGLHPKALAIVEKWKNTDSSNPYLFPILETGLNPITVKNRCKRFIKWVNLRMEKIRKELGIDQKIGTYAARHTFSTVMKRRGVSTEFIKESLGHSSVAVTENYLDSFNDDVKLDYTKFLTS